MPATLTIEESIYATLPNPLATLTTFMAGGPLILLGRDLVVSSANAPASSKYWR